jgi:REP element-mobilizing transposase RayT
MSHSLTQIHLHLVFSTKSRHPYFTDLDLRNRLHGYLAGACNNLDCPATIVGGVADHVHILCRFAKTIELAVLIREIKRESSKWIKTQSRGLREFHWQKGYGAFSISPGHVPPLKAYIRDQEEHHRRETFQDELRRLCAKYGIELDERYAWD